MKKNFIYILLSLVLVFSTTGCKQTTHEEKQNSSQDTIDENGNSSSTTSDSDDNTETENPTGSPSSISTNVDPTVYDLEISNRDQDASYDKTAACSIEFSDTKVTATGSGVTVEDHIVTINTEGTYILSGSAKNGQIIVDTDKNSKVQIVLNNLNLASTDNSPFIIKQADKVFLTLADNTVNTLSDATSYETMIDSTSVDATLFSKDDLTINGSGTLNISGNYKHGIVSKNDIVITDGNINITSNRTGIDAKDCAKLVGGNINITSGSDGIRSTNTEEEFRGFLFVDGTNITIDSQTDGLQAESLLYLSSGTLNITTGGGSINASTKTDNMPGGFQWGQWGSKSDSTSDATSDVAETETTASSAKALKCTNDIMVDGGSVIIDSSDDAIHANDSILINGGDIHINSGDDGLHADLTLTISAGTMKIEKSYEGLEAGEIYITGGNQQIIASDDGLNAAGGSDSSSTNGRPGQNPFDSDSSKQIYITGGYTVIDASGDGIDSNGSIHVSGGITLVNGPVNGGNGALDTGIDAEITGGVLIATGSSEMAETFSDLSSQGSIMTNIQTGEAGKIVALCDSNGNVLASFTPQKQYQNIVVSVPGIKSGETYTICSGEVADADDYGYTSSGTLANSTVLATIQMDSLHYGASASFGGVPGGGFSDDKNGAPSGFDGDKNGAPSGFGGGNHGGPGGNFGSDSNGSTTQDRTPPQTNNSAEPTNPI